VFCDGVAGTQRTGELAHWRSTSTIRRRRPGERPLRLIQRRLFVALANIRAIARAFENAVPAKRKRQPGGDMIAHR